MRLRVRLAFFFFALTGCVTVERDDTGRLVVVGQKKTAPAPAVPAAALKPPLSDTAKAYYSLGRTLSQDLTSGPLSTLSEEQMSAVRDGFKDGLLGKPSQVDSSDAGPGLDAMLQADYGLIESLGKLAASLQAQKGSAYVARMAKDPAVEQLPSGLIYKELIAGTGASPTATDTVQVNYEGKLLDGTVFDTTNDASGTATLPVDKVIPCWAEALQRMKVGGKAQLVCPASLAYGEMGSPPAIPGGATLLFTVELVGIEVKPVPLTGGSAHSNTCSNAAQLQSGLAKKAVAKLFGEPVATKSGSCAKGNKASRCETATYRCDAPEGQHRRLSVVYAADKVQTWELRGPESAP